MAKTDLSRPPQRFQVELSVGHQIIHAVIAEALHLLQKGEVEDRYVQPDHK